MKNKLVLMTVISAFGLASVAYALPPVTSGGTMAFSADVLSSINLIFTTDASGFTVTGSGSAAGTLTLGNVQMYGGTVPTNVTRTPNTNVSFTLSTPIDVEVDVANDPSSLTYSLLGNLNAADTTNTWTFNTVAVSAAGVTPQVTGASYGSATSYTLAVTIPATEAAGTISNTINFTATAN